MNLRRFAQKLTNCSKYASKTSSTIKLVPKMVAIYAFFWGNFKYLGILLIPRLPAWPGYLLFTKDQLSQTFARKNRSLLSLAPGLIVVCWFIRASSYIYFVKRNLKDLCLILHRVRQSFRPSSRICKE